MDLEEFKKRAAKQFDSMYKLLALAFIDEQEAEELLALQLMKRKMLAQVRGFHEPGPLKKHVKEQLENLYHDSELEIRRLADEKRDKIKKGK